MDNSKLRAKYNSVRQIAINAALNKEIPEDWREIIYNFDSYIFNDEHEKRENDTEKPRCDNTTTKFTLSKEIAKLINKYSAESLSETPDYILAEYLIDCLAAYNKAVVWKEKWNSSYGVPSSEQIDGPQLPRPGVEKKKF
jgi:hypothetical protein